MPIYMVVPIAGNAQAVDQAISSRVAEPDRYALPKASGWFVSFTGTTMELSKFLGITGQEPGEPAVIGSTVVTLVGSYYGRGPTDMWEWLKTRLERES